VIYEAAQAGLNEKLTVTVFAYASVAHPVFEKICTAKG